MKSRKFKSFLFLVVLFTAVTFSCDDSMPEPIYGTKPTVAFTATQSASDIFTWSFANNTTGAISYNWDFGDGSASTDANPTHTYSIPGSYTVTLTATAAGTSNSMGWRQSSSQAVMIEAPPLVCEEEQGFSTTVGAINLTASSDKNWKDGGDLWEQFGNIQSAQVANPALGEDNMSCMVNKLWDEDQTCEGWAGYGFRIGENCADPGPVCPDNILDFATETKKKFKMKVHGPEGAVIILKLEFNPYPNTSPAVERKIVLSAAQANKWSELVFDFSSETSGTYANMLVYTYNKDEGGSACGGQVIYVDDLVQSE